MSTQQGASFRDPSGFMFIHNGSIYRQVNKSYQHEYEQLLTSGLYERLTKSGAMVSHQEEDILLAPLPDLVFRVIKPTEINFISYPFEWSFGQLKEAALLTLAIAKRSLSYEMNLKDASAYNIQFQQGNAIFIDTLSFEIYSEGAPWVAYKQFCQHFLAPLALMAFTDIRLVQLMKDFIDGIPLDLASKLLPWSTRFKFGLLTHIHLHARSQLKHADQVTQMGEKRTMGRKALLGLLESLIDTVKRLTIKSINTEWSDYYEDTNYTAESFETKKQIISMFIDKVKPKTVWDLGANTGEFSRLASSLGISTVAFDIDPGAVQKNYETIKENNDKNILPLVMDMTNPSPSMGWHNQERSSLIDRGPADMILALALLHHLAISNNVPLEKVAKSFSELGQYLIIEFIPKTDSQVKRLLSTRLDIFHSYTKKGFKEAFSQEFNIISEQEIKNSKRVLYLMKRK